MKYMLSILLIFVCGCTYTSQRKVPSGEGYDLNYNVINIDGCQYIWFVHYHRAAISHKGDCTNSIHIYNKE